MQMAKLQVVFRLNLLNGVCRMSSLERIVPEELAEGETTGLETLHLHVARYNFAYRHLGGASRILDIACGVGYGSDILKHENSVASIVGVDISADAISYAQAHYARDGVSFVKQDVMTFEGAAFDAVISLETIEHLPAPEAFIARVVSKLLKPGGVFIGSAPVTPSVDANPHHMTDFSRRSFRRLLSSHGLVEMDSLIQVQPFNPFKVATRSEQRTENLRKNLVGFYASHPSKAVLRLWSTLKDGFNNKYLTLACRNRG